MSPLGVVGIHPDLAVTPVKAPREPDRDAWGSRPHSQPPWPGRTRQSADATGFSLGNLQKRLLKLAFFFFITQTSSSMHSDTGAMLYAGVKNAAPFHSHRPSLCARARISVAQLVF